jgi:hypothetical protein
MTIEELKDKIKKYEIDIIYIEVEFEDRIIMYPMMILYVSDNEFKTHVSHNRVMVFKYEEYKERFWLREDKSE